MNLLLQRLVELLVPPTRDEWILLLVIGAGLSSFVAISEIIRKHFHRSAEVTRKLVHVSVGILIFFAPKLFQSAVIPLSLALCGAIVMMIAVRGGLLVGMHGTSRVSYGTVYYPLSFFFLIILFWNTYPEIISLSMLSLAFGDAAAAIVGESLTSPIIYNLTSDKKSIQGSLTMFVVTALSVFGGMLLFDLQTGRSIGFLFLVAVIAAGIATAWEAISSKGFDNFTIPLSVALVLSYYLIPSLQKDFSQFTVGVLLSVCIAVISYYTKFLSTSGSVATFLLASTIFGIGGWKWTLPIFVFFILSSILSKMGKRTKTKYESIYEKTSVRDWGQVAANGGIAGCIMLLQYVWPNYDFYPAYLGSIAAVTADTWGTEIGIWFKGKTISLSNLHFVEQGTNGGVSLQGFFGGAIGAFIISMSSRIWLNTGEIVWISTGAGIVGSMVDSYLGGKIQAIYYCAICHKHTERTVHCNSQTRLVRGHVLIDNDAVNWACALTGAAVAFVLC